MDEPRVLEGSGSFRMPEKAIETLRHMISVEQSILSEITLDCLELADFPLLARIVVQRLEEDCALLKELPLAEEQFMEMVQQEIRRAECRLRAPLLFQPRPPGASAPGQA